MVIRMGRDVIESLVGEIRRVVCQPDLNIVLSEDSNDYDSVAVSGGGVEVRIKRSDIENVLFWSSAVPMMAERFARAWEARHAQMLEECFERR